MYDQHNHSPSEWEDGLENFSQQQNLQQAPPHPQHQQQYHPASNSRSDPSYDMRSGEIKMSTTSRPPPNFNHGFTGSYNMSSLPYQYHSLNSRHSGSDEQRQTAYSRAGIDHHHFSSSPVGLNTPPRVPHDGEDEPTDVLVWNATTTQGQNHHSRLSPPHHNNHRSHSDTEDNGRQSTRTSSNRALVSRSRSVKSLSGKLQHEEVNNGNLSAEEYENHLVAVTRQLELIKTTQDSILSELSEDISNLQFENVQLKNTNEHLTMQNSHLLQVISDLSNEVEHMRDVFRMRGWPIKHNSEEKADDNIVNNQKQGRMSDQEEKDIRAVRSPPRDRDAIVVAEPEVDKVVKRKHRSSSKKLHHSEKLETVPVDTQQHQQRDMTVSRSSTVSAVSNMNERHLPGPGDDQVAALSNRSSHHGHGGKHRKSRSKLPSTDSVDNNHSSKPNLRSMNDKNDDKDSDGGMGCFKNLFRRIKKRSQHNSANEMQ